MEKAEDSIPIIWEWLDKKNWVAYDLATCQVLEKAFTTEMESIILDHGVFSSGPYVVDFKSMTQVNQRTRFVRNIRRLGGQVTRKFAVWECKVKKKWTSYSDNIAKLLEDAFSSGQSKLSLEKYHFDLVEMKQINPNTGFEREIRRQVGESIRLPLTVPEYKRNTLMPKITGVTYIAPEKRHPCYGTVGVTIIGARNIAETSFLGGAHPDPFVVVTTDFSPHLWKTGWRFKTNAPTWNESCGIYVYRSNMEGNIIFTVYSKSLVSKDVYLGRLAVSLFEVIQSQKVDGWKQLDYECKSKSKTQLPCQLELNITWNPKSQPNISRIQLETIFHSPTFIHHRTLSTQSKAMARRPKDNNRPARPLPTTQIVEFADPTVIEGVYSNYKLGDGIGEGGFSVVKKATNLTSKETVAVKIIKTSVEEHSINLIAREIGILHVIDSDYCVYVFESRQTKDSIYIIMEYLPAGDLLDEILAHVFDEPRAKGVIHDILLGLEYLHNTGICHRDIKPENILYEKEQKIWKIADFGCATWFTSTQPFMEDFEGTIQYMAPEILVGTKYTKVVDFWSTGVLTYVALSSCFPWEGNTDAEIQESIIKNNLKFFSPEFDNVSPDATDFILRLVEPNCEKRMGIEEAFAHPWMSSEKN